MPKPQRTLLPLHVYVGTAPPPELIAAARRGECILAHGDGPKNVQRWARALARFVDTLATKQATYASSLAREEPR